MKLSFKEMIEVAERDIETMPIAEALSSLGSADTIFIDLRDIREIQRDGLIPGAFHCPRGMLEFWVHPESPYHKPIFAEQGKKFVFYCASGWRSALATRDVQALGLSPVAHVEGGFSAWKNAGGSIAEK
ncbi:MAG: rhodanese-like domain-containing protein [Pseudomonadota bacterium]